MERKRGIKIITRCPDLLARNRESLEAWINDAMTVLDLSREVVLKLVRREPRLASQKPDTLGRNVDRLAEAWDTGRKQVITAALVSPPLLYLDADAMAERARRLAALLVIPVGIVHTAFLKTPSLTGRNPAELARRAGLAMRIASARRQRISAGELLASNPFVLTYGIERLRMRYRLARLGVWSGAWNTLVVWSDRRLLAALARHVAAEPPGNCRARRLEAVIACGAQASRVE